MIRALSFIVVHETKLSMGDKPYLALSVSPCADGMPLLNDPRSLVFDADEVLARQTDPCEFDPFSCSCGEPYCAGLYDHAALSIDGDLVVWEFPETGYRGELNERLFPAGAPMRVRFNRALYREALDGLARIVRDLEKESGLPAVFEPSDHVADRYLETPLDKRLSDAREQFLERQAHEDWRRKVWGPLLDVSIRAALANGQVYAMSVESLGRLLARRKADGKGREEALRAIDADIAPRLRAGDGEILEAVRGTTWAEAEYRVWLWRDNRPQAEWHQDVPADEMAALWRGASFTLAPDA